MALTICDQPLVPASPALCRYKTGRCMNPRVVKPNGALLLLCEFHRCQQNRTKKRSDMKYRQHRAAKRQLERAAQQPHKDDARSDCSTGFLPHQSPRPNLSATQQKSLPSDSLSPADNLYLAHPALGPFGALPPPAVDCPSSMLKPELPSRLLAPEALVPEAVTSSSPTTMADFESAVSPGPSVWADALLPRSPLFAPPFPPLSPPSPSRSAWQPEELELLEYFIMS